VSKAEEFTPAEKPDDIFGMDEEETDPYAPIDSDFQDDDMPSFATKNLWWIITLSIVVVGIVAIFLIPVSREKVLSVISGSGQQQEQEIVLGDKTSDEEESTSTEDALKEAKETNDISEEIIKGVVERKKIEQEAAKSVKSTVKQPATASAASKTASKSTVKPVTKTPYNVIVASFDSEANARRELNNYKNQGFVKARILVYDDKYRVSAGSFATREDADKFIRSKELKAWVFKEP
jgi:hypothetical protein